MDDSIPDCCVCKFENSNIYLIALYIPPINSKFFNINYMNNLRSLFLNHNLNDVFFVGDFNSRTANRSFNTNELHIDNPDKIINSHGKSLLNLLTQFTKYRIINGIVRDNTSFDSNFTFFRGKLKSQIDLCITNNIDIINSFQILHKLPFSDHCPCILNIKMNLKPNMQFLIDSIEGLGNYSHVDINYRLPGKINFEKINIEGLQLSLDNLANELNEKLLRGIDIDEICYDFTNNLHEACITNYQSHSPPQIISNDQYSECSSANFKAIANANHFCYQYLISTYGMSSSSNYYWNQWIHFSHLARVKENEEYNCKFNKKWHNCDKNNSKKLWQLINWKEKPSYHGNKMNSNVIDQYFSSIFQSPKTFDNPTLETFADEIEMYTNNTEITQFYIPDEIFDTSLWNVSKGISIDSLPPALLDTFTPDLKNIYKKLLEYAFSHSYPNCWSELLLTPIPKPGHSIEKPRIRGISVSPLLSRPFDTIVNDLFLNYYQPNREQSGFRRGQMITFQLFSIILILEHCYLKNKSLYIACLDYETAFDVANRGVLLKKLIQNNFDPVLVKAIYNMYSQTSYCPKIDANTIGKKIATEHGVSQGKTSSPNFFSFYVSDMPDFVTLDNNDVRSALLQVADDTALTAGTKISLTRNLRELLDYSRDNYLIVNVTKTKYLHMSNTPDTSDIGIENDIIQAIKPGEYHKYIGFILTPTNSLINLIKLNLSERKFNVAKYYSWLNENEYTPFFIKLRVLYQCMFPAIVYSMEAWGDISCISTELLKIEREILKRIMGVRNNIDINLIFFELNKYDIHAGIKLNQFNFFKKLCNIPPEEAKVFDIVNICSSFNSPTINYYRNISENVTNECKQLIYFNINSSINSMNERYINLFGLSQPYFLYNSNCNDKDRKIITRWRFSCHSLRIETGRYFNPPIPRFLRTCIICNLVEDEIHAIYTCKAHSFIRQKYTDILHKNPDLKSLFNPMDCITLTRVANILYEIEDNRESLCMNY